MQRQRKIGKQSHVTLVARTGGRHRERIGQQTVIVRLAKEIAPQQLPRVRCSLDPFYDVRQQMPLVFRFVGTARMCEMRFGAPIGKNQQAEDECRPKAQQR